MPVPEQQKAIAKMRKLCAKGLSLRAIRDRLAEEDGVRVSPGRRVAGGRSMLLSSL